MFFHYIVYVSAFILCIHALPVEENPNTKQEFKGFKYLGSLKRNGPDGTIMESEYYLSDVTAAWSLASLGCYYTISGSKLLSLEDEAEDMFIKDLLFEEGLTGGVWSSANYVEEEEGGIASGWIWDALEPIPITYFNFKTPPNNSSYYSIVPNGTPGNYGWSTALGALSFNYICEKML